jgi:hypothetical protein
VRRLLVHYSAPLRYLMVLSLQGKYGEMLELIKDDGELKFREESPLLPNGLELDRQKIKCACALCFVLCACALRALCACDLCVCSVRVCCAGALCGCSVRVRCLGALCMRAPGMIGAGRWCRPHSRCCSTYLASAVCSGSLPRVSVVVLLCDSSVAVLLWSGGPLFAQR